ncbi:MAG: hypothetical protein R3185_05350, partial [Candidatus Thermoplasmatota archaeon]|nr:hypothetical protein [Candidatus Thermoplasmatota archaeon]
SLTGDWSEGLVTVTDDLGAAVEGATVAGVATYYGTEDVPMGLEIAEVSGTTGADGTFEFSYSPDVATFAGQNGVLNLPGYHEVELVITSPSRDTAPTDDLETTTLVLKYWMGPRA